MKTMIQKYIRKGSASFAFLLVAIGGGLASCSDSYMEKLNTDGTKVSELDPNAQLTTSLLQTYGDFSLMDTYRSYITGFTQYYAGGWNVTNYAGSVHFENNQTRLIWDRYYEISIKNLVDAIQHSEDKPNLNAALRIHKVYIMSVLTDTYGDLPYKEAGLGYISGVSTPKYDTQEDIYNDFFTELAACEEQLGTGSDKITGDVTSMGGDVNLWKKYANSLRLRFAMRISDVNPQKAQEEFEKAMNQSAGYIANANEDAYVIYSDSPFTYYDGAKEYDFRTNALGEMLYGQDPSSPTMICTSLFNQLKNTNDPRLYRICRHYYNIKRSQIKPDKEGNLDLTDEMVAYFKSAGRAEAPCNPGAAWYNNWVNPVETSKLPTLKKLADEDPDTYNSQDYRARATRPNLSIDFEQPTCPGILMTSAEVEFLLAEAKSKGWNVSGTAESHYEAGVKAAMQLLNNHYLSSNKISDAEISEFIQNNPLGENARQTINTQAWILHLTNPAEGWANMRRSDYPILMDRKKLDKFTNGFVYDDPNMTTPVRLKYPELEGQYNSANYNAAIERMGGTDDWHKRLWWDAYEGNFE